MTASSYHLHQGKAPLLISLPHVGTAIPDTEKKRYLPHALEVKDTDWHLETLYGFAKEMGVSMLVPHYSRYVIDLNRPPEDTPMYVGSNNTELCPTHAFSGALLYRDGQAPDKQEIRQRRALYWDPYHAAITTELARLKKEYGYVILFDGHSINSVLPWLFEGRLPDLNLGTVAGSSCSFSLRESLITVLERQTIFSQVVDGRFKGGYITRHYGQPQNGIHAVQLEMGFRCYMEEKFPYRFDPQRAAILHPVLRSLVTTMLMFRPADAYFNAKPEHEEK